MGAPAASRVVDISVRIDEQTVVWPGDPRPRFEPVRTLERDGVRLTRLTLGTHTGTHVDAPSHFLAGGATVDQMDLEPFVGPCRVIDLANVTGPIGPRHLSPFGARRGERLLFRTRNSALLRARRWDERFVTLHLDAARLLVDAGVRLVGIDYLSVEHAAPEAARVHQTLLDGGVAILETIDLMDVAAGAYLLVAAPLRLGGLDGSPVRALLLPPEEMPAHEAKRNPQIAREDAHNRTRAMNTRAWTTDQGSSGDADVERSAR